MLQTVVRIALVEVVIVIATIITFVMPGWIMMNYSMNNNQIKCQIWKHRYHDELPSHFRCLTKALIMTERRKLGLDKNSTKF